jgi:DGQHR domain-containing protein
MRFTQPAGDFFLAVMKAEDVVGISSADPRHYDPERFQTLGGVQRPVSEPREKEIAAYCDTTDAAFPTAVILAVRDGNYVLNDNKTEVTLTGSGKFANIVDGQHRLAGLARSHSLREFSLPVVLLLDATLEEQALLFATINGKQTKVNASLIYDLFGLTQSRSPQRTAHELARALNATPESPWFSRLKMLGKKSREDSLETVTQGTFVREVLKHISSKPANDFAAARSKRPFETYQECVFNRYFLHEEDQTILRILMNLFQAQRDVWPVEWDNPDRYILTKSTGFMATMWSLKALVGAGQRNKTLTRQFFADIFERSKRRIVRDGKELTGDNYASSSQGIGALRRVFEDTVVETAGV